MFLFLYLLVDELNLLIKLHLLFFRLLDQIRQLSRRLLTVLVGIIRNLDDAIHLLLLRVEVVAQLGVHLLEYLPLASQLVYLSAELRVACHSVIVSLIGLVQPKLEVSDVFQQLLVLLVRLDAIHELLLVQYLRLNLANFLVEVVALVGLLDDLLLEFDEVVGRRWHGASRASSELGVLTVTA